MRSRRHGSATVLALLLIPSLVVAQTPRSAAPRSSPPPAAAFSVPFDANIAVNQPDQFSWMLFIALNKLAPTQPVVNGNTLNNALWETWADDPTTFPSSPDLSNPPQWPSGAINIPPDVTAPVPATSQPKAPAPGSMPAKRLRPGIKQLIHDDIRGQMRITNVHGTQRGLGNAAAAADEAAPSEEVHRNRQAFDFIVQNNLWYTQGLAKAFASGQTVTFPTTSIEVKANWVPIQASQKSQYHWNYDANGNLIGLVAMHIISKTIPNWTWATFEWAGNAGRCDYIGCHDQFGYTPANIAPQTPTGGQYPAGTITPALQALFTTANLAPEFSHYRLKGSQIDFVTPTGIATLLGNSVTESGFVSTSSCMTCHSRAAVDSSGVPTPNAGFIGQNSPNGAPNPQWFFNTSTSPYTPTYVPIDFVWGIINAAAAPPTTSKK
jgi:hypothetical protein